MLSLEAVFLPFIHLLQQIGCNEKLSDGLTSYSTNPSDS